MNYNEKRQIQICEETVIYEILMKVDTSGFLIIALLVLCHPTARVTFVTTGFILHEHALWQMSKGFVSVL